MKKFTAIAVAVLIVMSLVTVIPVHAAEEFSYAHITASGNDPYATFTFNPNGNHSTIDPETVKWAAIKYRTVTETDNTGVQLIGQLYVSPAVEPFIPIKYEHTRQWETIIVDLTSVSEKTELESVWTTKYTDLSGIRFDPLESNRDAEAQDTENDVARVQDGDSIDIAFLAFFENEEDARAYDGTQDTPYCIILPEDLEWYAGDNAIDSVEVFDGKKPRPTEEATVTEEPKDDTTVTEAEQTDVESTEAEATADNATGTENGNATEAQTDNASATDEQQTPGTMTEQSGDDNEGGKFPVWGIIAIAVAAVILAASIIVLVVNRKK